MKLFQKAKFFSGLWWRGKKGCLSHAHTGPKVVLTTFESFRSKNLKKEIDSESACSEDSASLFKIKIRGLQAQL
jgi:hypothetical protein